MKRKTNKASKKLDHKKVEDGLLVFLQGGTPTADVEFGEAEVKFKDRKLFTRSLGFRDFKMNNISYKLAAKDEIKMTITYLFHQ